VAAHHAQLGQPGRVDHRGGDAGPYASAGSAHPLTDPVARVVDAIATGNGQYPHWQVKARIGRIRGLLKRRVHADFGELQREVDQLEHDLAELLTTAHGLGHGCTCGIVTCDEPSSIKITATIGGTPLMADQQIPAGQTIALTAVVDNAEGQPVPDTLSWTATAGTVTANPDDPSTLTATLANAPVGTVTVTATDAAGVTGSLELDIVDATPASITLSAAAVAPAAPSSTPASA
jgi:hypothetical protein